MFVVISRESPRPIESSIQAPSLEVAAAVVRRPYRLEDPFFADFRDGGSIAFELDPEDAFVVELQRRISAERHLPRDPLGAKRPAHPLPPIVVPGGQAPLAGAQRP